VTSNQKYLIVITGPTAIGKTAFAIRLAQYFQPPVSPEHDPKMGMVKDLAAGAVLITAIAALITGLIIFIPKIF